MASRLQYARQIVRDLRALTDSVVVFLSGGKDSLVILDLICGPGAPFEGSQVAALHMYLHPDLEIEMVPIKHLVRRFQIREFHSWPHPSLQETMQWGFLRIPRLEGEMLSQKKFGLKQVEEVVKSVTGADYVVDGQRKMDSPHRRGMLSSWGLLDTKFHRCHPIGEWSDSEVYSYCNARDLVRVPRLGDRIRVSGLGLTPDVLRDLWRDYPRDFDKVCRVYHFAPALPLREGLRQQAKDRAGTSA